MFALLLVGTAPAFADKPRVVVLDFSSSSDNLKRVANSVAEQVLTELARTNAVEVLGTSDVSALLGMERQRQLLGCSSDASTSCLAEITAAMGAPWVVMGNLAQLGKVTRLDIKLIRASDGKAVLREGKNLTDESQIFDLVNDIVGRMLKAMALQPQPKVEPAPVPPKVEPVQPKAEPVQPKAEPVQPKAEPVQPKAEPPQAEVTKPPESVVAATPPRGGAGPWVIIGGGAAVAVGGGLMLFFGAAQHSATVKDLSRVTVLPNEALWGYEEAKSSLERSNTLMLAGSIVGGVGLLAVAGGLTWKFVGKSPGTPTTVSLVPGPSSLVVRGEF